MASNGFLKLDGVTGDSQDESHGGEIEIQSFSWGASNSSGSAGGAGKANISDFSIVKICDQATPVLFQRCCNGDKSATADVTLRSTAGGQVEFLKIHFEDVYVTSWQSSGQCDGSVPMESVSFSFDKAHITEQPPDPTMPNQGPFDGGYDLEAANTY
jgi:type VI secretion system secreted protein Hcp